MTWIGIHEVDITEEHIKPYVSQKEGESKKITPYFSVESTGKEYLLIRSSYVIGKDRTADIKIGDNRCVANKHAVLQKEREQYYLTDVSPVNGIRINGERIEPNKKYLLTESVKIEIGNAVCRFELG